jgi:8-oxo-dGTP pyrophosphatase MutT (NUDIX family)
MPSYPYSDAFLEEIAGRCAGFPRIAYEGDDLKRSAVVIGLVDASDGSGETAFVLTRRPSKMRAHAGQWALPGGRCDPGETLIQTALRELQEELGLEPGEAAVLGVLDDYVTRSGYVMAPVVMVLKDPDAIVANPDEVASVHRIRLDEISRDEAIEFFPIPESDKPVLRLRFGQDQIHAPTAALLYQLRELAEGRITRVDGVESPVFAWR